MSATSATQDRKVSIHVNKQHFLIESPILGSELRALVPFPMRISYFWRAQDQSPTLSSTLPRPIS